MAGALAEAVHFGEPVKEAVDREADDMLMTLEVAGDLHEDDGVVGRHLLKAGQRVLDLYDDLGVWKAVQAVAAKLATFGYLSGHEVHRIVRRHAPEDHVRRPAHSSSRGVPVAILSARPMPTSRADG
jgi:hypothetical protein